MRTVRGTLAGLTISALALAATPRIAAAQPGEHCTRESFAVDGAPVVATLCVPPDAKNRVTVTETFARGGTSFSRTLSLDVVPGARVTRTVDEVSLDAVGSPKRLHLTIAFRDGEAAVEHALLLPGALILK